MSSRQILIVDDEKPICSMISLTLTREGYDCAQAHDARSAQLKIAERRPDLILADWMLPDVSGIELMRNIKQAPRTRDIPIIMLSARAAEQDKVTGLDSGADDYIVKPFSRRELLARIDAVLRRVMPLSQAEVITATGLVLERLSRRVIAHDRTVPLSATEYRLLEFFMTHPHRVHSRSHLLDRIWGGDSYVDERTVDVHIMRLRKLLAQYGCDGLIHTVRSAGYRFSAEAGA